MPGPRSGPARLAMPAAAQPPLALRCLLDLDSCEAAGFFGGRESARGWHDKYNGADRRAAGFEELRDRGGFLISVHAPATTPKAMCFASTALCKHCALQALRELPGPD